jgi:CRISPR-associated endonuclease Cas1
MTATKNRTANSRLLANPRGSGIDATRRPAHFHRLFAPSHGVVVLTGYGIRVHVDRGHLIVEDGVGADRRKGRFPRVHHGLRRVVVIGSDGMVSLAAIRWLADQNIAFAMLERDGSVLLTTGPVAASDTRIRRAQACALHSDAAVLISRELIRRKIMRQAELVRDGMANDTTADHIAHFAEMLSSADSLDSIRLLEGQASFRYWQAWECVAITFPKTDLARVPDHWQAFGTRRSPLSKNARRATTPANALLNYLYTLLETETRLAINALGLDAGLGLLHADTASRDSLVYDLMEPIRPVVDAYLFKWISQSPLKRSWFFEERDGKCRLMADVAMQLADTVQTWSREIAPIAEWYVKELCSHMLDMSKIRRPGTRLTQERRRAAVGSAVPVHEPLEAQRNHCENCGALIAAKSKQCLTCAREVKRLFAAEMRKAAKTPEVRQKRSESAKRSRGQQLNWSPSELPAWLTDELYLTRIQPLLKDLPRKATADALGVTTAYIRGIISGKHVPHKRHWAKLAELVGVSVANERANKTV